MTATERFKSWGPYIITLAVVWAIWAAMCAWIIQPFAIPSESMMSTLHTHDRVLVDKMSGGSAHRGDVVVFGEPSSWREPDEVGDAPEQRIMSALLLSSSGNHLVKRVIGVGGDTVACRGHDLSVNGHIVHEPYINHGMTSCSSTCPMQSFSINVPRNTVWVMGDNRDDSADSRCHPEDGFVPTSKITGRVVADIWPMSRWGVHLSDHKPFRHVAK